MKYDRFVADRIPSEGGMQIVKYSEAITEDEKSQIEEIMEFTSKDYEHNCMSVYPLRGDRFCLLAARKCLSDRETRTHHAIRGVVVNKSELKDFCKYHIVKCGGKEDSFFFPPDTDLKHPEQWKNPLVDTTKDDLKYIIGEIYESMEDFANAIRQVYINRRKIILKVEPGFIMGAFAMMTYLSVKTGCNLFIAANGESTPKTPDIIINDGYSELEYTELQTYKKMSLMEFCDFGRASKAYDKEKKSREEEDKKEKLFRDMCYRCEQFLQGNIAEESLYAGLSRFKKQDESAYKRLKLEIKRLLANSLEQGFTTNRNFYHLLYVAFKKEDVLDCTTPELVTAPYDFDGMMTFLRKHANNRRMRERLIQEMFDTQFSACYGNKYTARMIRKGALLTVKKYEE